MRRSAYLLITLATAILAPSGRSLMQAASCGRLLYGLMALLAPRKMAGVWAAAEPESVMNLRGFGGGHAALAVFTLVASRSGDLARPALLLNAGNDVADGIAGGFELRERGAGDGLAVGGVLIPAINIATWLWALRRLDA